MIVEFVSCDQQEDWVLSVIDLPGTRETEAGEFLRVGGQPGLHSQGQPELHIVRPYLQKT